MRSIPLRKPNFQLGTAHLIVSPLRRRISRCALNLAFNCHGPVNFLCDQKSSVHKEAETRKGRFTCAAAVDCYRSWLIGIFIRGNGKAFISAGFAGKINCFIGGFSTSMFDYRMVSLEKLNGNVMVFRF